MRDNSKPLFVGLTHIGQVFSIGWAKKFQGCTVYDFNKNRYNDFKRGHLTAEEPNLLKFFKENKKKINFCKSKRQIKKFKNIFFTVDTYLDQQGKPNFKILEYEIKSLIKFLSSGTNLIILSQARPGFCDNIIKKYIKNLDINLIFMVDTLVMGDALNRFLEPERIILGTRKKLLFFKNFKKFNCPIFFTTIIEAETIKMAINLFLLNSVSYANSLDFFCRELGFKFSNIIPALRMDKRIGAYSYISPSLGLGGGHLERDLSNILKKTKNNFVKNFFISSKKLDYSRINLLIKTFQDLDKQFAFDTICWLGVSYKKESFSIKNSPFIKFYNFIKNKKKKFIIQDSFFNLKKINIGKFKFSNKIMSKNILFIYNYLGSKDKNKFELIFKEKINIYFLNISLQEKKINHINYSKLL